MSIVRTILVMSSIFMAAVCMRGQSVTSSGLSGSVRAVDGGPLGGATIRALHEPTGTEYAATSDDSGRYRITGMQTGGPYVVEVVRTGFQSRRSTGIELALGQAITQNFVLSAADSDVFDLEAFVVSAEDDDFLFTEGSMGSFTTIDLTTITSIPSITRSISDITRLDPRMAVYDRDQWPDVGWAVKTRVTIRC
jgi:hypothetical protein